MSELRREIILLSRWTGWSLEAIEDLTLPEFWDWLKAASDVEAEIGGSI